MHLTSVTIVASLASFSFSQPNPTLQVPRQNKNPGGATFKGGSCIFRILKQGVK